MSQTPYELFVRMNENGTVKGVHVRYLFTVGNKVVEGDPEPLAGTNDSAFTAFAEQFAAAAVAERDQLAVDKAEIESQIETLTGERDAALAQVATLTDEKAALTEANTTLTAQLAAANARIAQLIEQIPYNPRVMEAKAFLRRLLPNEVYSLLRSEDEVSLLFGAMLDQYIANDWPVVLDSEQLQAAMTAFVTMGKLTQERSSSLTADCTREEAYLADGGV